MGAVPCCGLTVQCKVRTRMAHIAFLLLTTALTVIKGIQAQENQPFIGIRQNVKSAQLREEDRLVKKNTDLAWFPAEVKEDCANVTEANVELRQGKPSLSCRVDEERFCLCGKVGKGEAVQWRFLCGTCKISFKLDRLKEVSEEAKKPVASKVRLNANRGLNRPNTRLE